MMIRDRRLEAGLTMESLAKRVGCSKGLMSQIEKGRSIESTGFGKVMTLAKILGLDANELVDLSNVTPQIKSPRIKVRRIPVFNYAQALNPEQSMQNRGENAEMTAISVQGDLADKLSKNGFALKITGTSMLPEYKDGDQVVIDPDADYEPGQIVIAALDGMDEAVLRKYRPRGQDSGGPTIELTPLNADYPTLHINEQTPGRVIGVVVRHIRDPRAK